MLAILKIIRTKNRTEPGCHLYCTVCRLVLLSHFNIAKLFHYRILFSPVIFDRLYWNWALKRFFFLSDFLFYHYSDFCYCRSLLYYGKFRKKNREKIRTIYPENDENFKNSMPRVQFPGSYKKRIYLFTKKYS